MHAHTYSGGGLGWGWVWTWAICVEDASNPDVHIILAVVVEEQGLCRALAFIVAGPHADAVDVPPVLLRLWRDIRVAVHLTGGRLKDACLDTLGQTEHVHCTHERHLLENKFYKVCNLVHYTLGGIWANHSFILLVSVLVEDLPS